MSIDEIGLSEYINCVLVNEDVRNAMLIQAADYKEATHLDTITQNKLQAISEHFPNLKQSPLKMGNVLISKKKYYKKNVQTEQQLGEILGYPCANEFTYNNLQYSISIDAIFIDDSVQIIGMRCKDENYPILNTFAQKALEVLKKDPNIGYIKDVKVIIEKDISPESIIDKLISHIKLTKEEIYAIKNYLFNTGFGSIQSYEFEYDNQIHIGILCTLISYYVNDPIMAFAPLQKFPNEYKKSDEITKKLENSMIDILNKSKRIKKKS